MKILRLSLMCFCLVSVFLDACHNEQTKIILAETNSPRWLDAKVDVIAVGKNGQLVPENKARYPLNHILGTVNWYIKNDITIKNKENGNVQSIPIRQSTVMQVVEPLLTKELHWSEKENKDVEGYAYGVKKRWRRDPKEQVHFFEFFGNDALFEAKRDLALCYENLLKSVFCEMQLIRKKSAIAILPLGIDTGIPWKTVIEIAVHSVCDYVEKNPDYYHSIYLCVIKTATDYDAHELYSYYEQLLCAREVPND